jgi:CRP-like cAMP-binding protein
MPPVVPDRAKIVGPPADRWLRPTARREMTEPIILKLERFGPLSDRDKSAMLAAVRRTREVAGDSDIVSDGDRPIHSCLLTRGFAARYKVLPNGKRQITAIHVAGDFVDLHSFLLKRMDHGVVALTACTVDEVPHAALERITEALPQLTRILWLSTLVDGAIHREWIVCLGRRSAHAHCAHLLCELLLRLEVVGLAEHGRFVFPITQEELADALGISAVHVNRTLQDLRAEGLITWIGDTVTVLDRVRLAQVAQFDATYLNLQA